MSDVQPLVALLAQVNDMSYAVPLIVAVSLVYAATRHEDAKPILIHAGRVAGWITGFLAVILFGFWFFTRNL